MAKFYKRSPKTRVFVANENNIYFWKSPDGVSVEIQTGKYNDICYSLKLTREDMEVLNKKLNN